MKESKTLVYLKSFIESNYDNLDLFKKACHKNINLEIYLCIPEKELIRILQEYKNQGINNAKDLSSRLVNDQPAMNKTLEIYEKATLKIQQNIDNYIKYHGFKMANSAGSAEDWYTEFLIKYWYNVNFYKVRWFFPETLKKESKVKYKMMLYKDFLYQSKAIISNEKRLKAHQAAKKTQDSLFKTSLDKDFKDSNRNLKDTVSDANDMSFKIADFNIFKNSILTKIVKDVRFFSLINKCITILQNDDIKPTTPEGKLVLIMAYLCGMESLSLYKWIDKLSGRQKAYYGISQVRLKRQIRMIEEQPSTEDINASHNKCILNTYDSETMDKYNEWKKKFEKNAKQKRIRKRVKNEQVL